MMQKTNRTDEFLIDREPRSWSAPGGFPATLTPQRMFTQDAPNGLEVVLARASRRPTAADLRKAWDKRKAGRASPVLLIVSYPTLEGRRVSVYGPVGDQPARHDLEVSQAERMADVALGEPSHHAATLPEVDSPMPGVRNVGLLATQELQAGVPARSDWNVAVDRASPLLGLRGRRLMEGLGFGVEALRYNASMLTINGAKRAVAVFCDEEEPFEAPAQRFNNASPVSRALAVADQEGVHWVVLTRSSEIRLYAARPDTGVGRKGRAETFVELNLALLPREQSGYLYLLFSSEALAANGTVEQILAESARFAADLAVRLRERVYNETVPLLAEAVAARLASHIQEDDLSEEQLADAYEAVMVILFRLLFVAYAEDKDLLPYRTNEWYHSKSLTGIAQRLADDELPGDPVATALWDDVNRLWLTVDQGNIGWGVPAYNGGLFSSDPGINPSAKILADLRLTDAEMAPALAALLVDKGKEGKGPVDFRSLSVREFGTIYEGLLESRLSVAREDLTLNRRGVYVPAKPPPRRGRAKSVRAGTEVAVPAGSVYLHNRSGVRKSTGSYFTKPFAVEHLLDHALEPALSDHLARLDALREAGDDAALAEAFFDFRCADIAMGSGHFLVAAVDRIEARLSAWLSLHPIPAVVDELARLRRAALGSLGVLADGVEIETGSLLRRQVARHCVYGVDLNRVAVELARLGIWVHTFVPGLPLSFLDHNFVQGDSLTGVASLGEVVTTFDPDADPDKPTLFRIVIESWLAKAEHSLRRLARTSDADKREIEQARQAHRSAREEVVEARALFDVITAVRAGACSLPEFDERAIVELAATDEVAEAIDRFDPVHFPSTFPEVFLRDRPGFDCLLGNPPWEKVVVDREIWWGTHLPGVRSLPVAQRRARINSLEHSRPDLAAEYKDERQRTKDYKVLLRATFPRLGSGNTDLYKAFSWANYALIREGGRLGTVLPRSAVADAGMANWRTEIIRERERESKSHRMSISTLINNRGWVFDGIHNSYTVALVVVTRSSRWQPVSTPASGHSRAWTGVIPSLSSSPTGGHSGLTRGGGFEEQGQEPLVAIYPGPANSLSHFVEIVSAGPETVPVSEFTRWSNNGAFPQIPSREAFRVWRKMKQHQRFTPATSSPPPRRRWRLRPVQGDFNSTTDRHRFLRDDGRGASGQSPSFTPRTTETDS